MVDLDFQGIKVSGNPEICNYYPRLRSALLLVVMKTDILEVVQNNKPPSSKVFIYGIPEGTPA